jgi:hypothetical protein
MGLALHLVHSARLTQAVKTAWRATRDTLRVYGYNEQHESCMPICAASMAHSFSSFFMLVSHMGMVPLMLVRPTFLRAATGQ